MIQRETRERLSKRTDSPTSKMECCTSPLHSLENLKPGDHLCVIYDTEEEHRTVLTPFLRKGLENKEKVMYIVDARTSEVILNYLRSDGMEVEPYLDSGQLSIVSRDDAYLRDGIFNPDGMISLLKVETGRALTEGYSALRVTGEMTWALQGLPGSERLIEYEIKLNEFFHGSKCLAICQYDRRCFEPEILINVLRTHPIAVVGTKIYDNFYYIPPACLLIQKVETAVLQRMFRNLIERNCIEEERQHLLASLQEALSKVKTLSGLLPICSSCKKIRDDQGYWREVESYIRDHSEADFSHSFCPECMTKLYPKYVQDTLPSI